VRPRLLYLLPTSDLYGGIRVVLEHAEGMARRGWQVGVAGPGAAPDWHPLTVPYRQVDLDRPETLPAADVVVATFWTTVAAAHASGAPHVFHFCQGFEGVHREYAPLLPRIDAVYRLPVPKLLVSAHLEPVLAERYGCRTYLVGQSIDTALFTPGELRESPRPLLIGVVGPFAVRSKGIPELLAGLALARRGGWPIEVHRAAAEPQSAAEAALGVVDRYEHRLPTREMPAFYRRLDAYVHPSHDEEGYPLPPLEAMACGVPVAVTRIRSFAVVPDEAVVRYACGDPRAVPPVVAALADPARRLRLRAAGLAYAAEMTLDRVLDRVEAAFAAEGVPRAAAGER
jgi:glycosyltransferase involved in cell wall biosynthesis